MITRWKKNRKEFFNQNNQSQKSKLNHRKKKSSLTCEKVWHQAKSNYRKIAQRKTLMNLITLTMNQRVMRLNLLFQNPLELTKEICKIIKKEIPAIKSRNWIWIPIWKLNPGSTKGKQIRSIIFKQILLKFMAAKNNRNLFQVSTPWKIQLS